MLRLTIIALLFSLNLSANPIDSCAYFKRRLDTVNHHLYQSQMKLQKVQFYIAICDKKPTNKKFFFGWIKRAVK